MPLLLLRHCLHRLWLVTGTFHMREVSMPRGGHCNGADFTEIFKFRNPGGTEHTQTLFIIALTLSLTVASTTS